MTPPARVLVRPATTADRGRIVAIDRATQTWATSPAGPPPDDADPFEDRDPTDVLVAVRRDEVVGYANLGRPSPLPAHVHVWEIQGFAVDPPAQGVGVGRALVDGAVHEVARRGGRKVSLRVLADNTGARALYERAGFVVEGVLRDEFVLDGRSADDVLMARHL